MRKPTTRRLPAGALALALLAAPFAAVARDDFRWNEVTREIEALAFPQHFRDSLQQAHHVEFAPALRSVPHLPMRQEKLTMAASWGPIDAGYAVLKAGDDSATGRFLVTASAMSNGFVSAFFKVRDLLWCCADTGGLYPFFMEEHLREGRYKANRWILFDHVNEKVYTSKRELPSAPAPRFSQSIATLLYRLRTLQFAPNDTFTIDCFVQPKSYHVLFKCRRRETVDTDIGRFPCLLVEPVLTGEGRVFTKKDQLRMWFTDDAYKMPVLVKLKIAVGSLSLRLVKYERR